MLRLDRTAPRISSARKLVPFLALPNGTSDIRAVALRTQLLGGAGPELRISRRSGLPMSSLGERYEEAWKGREGQSGRSLCSRNAHDQNVLVRRAHGGTDPGQPLKSVTSWLGGSIY